MNYAQYRFLIDGYRFLIDGETVPNRRFQVPNRHSIHSVAGCSHFVRKLSVNQNEKSPQRGSFAISLTVY
ncbi:hypothetical protein VEV10F_12560 [Escherichia coli]|nr:hypothetical protein VEV10F_12560 [Escherichia coli]